MTALLAYTRTYYTRSGVLYDKILKRTTEISHCEGRIMDGWITNIDDDDDNMSNSVPGFTLRPHT